MDDYKADHELLIRIDEKVQQLTLDIKELKDSFADRVLALEMNKLDKADAERYRMGVAEKFKEYDDRFKRNDDNLKRNDRLIFIGVGLLMAIEIGLRFL